MDAIFTTMEDWTAENTFNYGVFSLIPILLILVIAVWKKTTFPAILAGVLAACFMVAKFNPLVTLGLFVDEFFATACDADNMWVIVLDSQKMAQFKKKDPHRNLDPRTYYFP